MALTKWNGILYGGDYCLEQCDTLYGVTMQKDGVSKVLKVQLKDAVHIAKEEK